MPTYEYKCVKCNKTFEKFQSVTEDTLKQCIYCEGEVNRVFHPVGIVFKGSGFYMTDYKKSEVRSKKSEDRSKKESETKKEDKTPACANKDNCAAAGSCQ